MTLPHDREIIAYGAAAEPEPALRPLESLRARLRLAYHLSRDRLRWKAGDTSSLDYRNYQDQTSLNRGDQAIVDAVLRKLEQRKNGLNFRRTNWHHLDSVSGSAQMVAVCGGGYLFIDKHAQLAERIQTDLRIFDDVSTPVVLFGVGVNQLIEPDRRADPHVAGPASGTLTALLDRADLISVRDWTTHRILGQHTSKPIHMVGDPALYLAPPRPVTRPIHESLRVGFNIPFHGPTLNTQIRQNLPKYVKLLLQLQREYSCRFYYIVHYDAERPIAQLLKDAGIALSVVRGQPDELLAAYGELDLHLGGMLHSCILSTSAGTPCIGLAYDVKHPGFFEVMEQPDLCVSAVNLDIDEVLSVFRQVHGRLQPLRQEILARRVALEQVFDEFVDQSLSLIGAS